MKLRERKRQQATAAIRHIGRGSGQSRRLAAAAIGAFAAEALRRQQERSRRKVHADNEGGGMTYRQIGKAYQASLNAFKAAQERYRAMEAKIERMEAEQERRWQQARTPASPAFDMAKWKQQEYAESARWEQQQAYQRYRQGEWAEAAAAEALVAEGRGCHPWGHKFITKHSRWR